MKKLIGIIGLTAAILWSAVLAQNTMHRQLPQKQQAKAALFKNMTEKKSPALASMTMAAVKASKAVKASATAKTSRQSPTLGHRPLNPNAGQTSLRFLPQATYKSAKNQDKATIKLLVMMDWGNGTGYQLLLDNKHEMASLIAEGAYQLESQEVEDVYAAATGTIPANASPEDTQASVIGFPDDPTADSVVIAPGTYDVLVVNVSEWEGTPEIYLGTNGVFDDLEFEAGTTYVFLVIPDGWSDLVRLFPPYDLAAGRTEVSTGNCGVAEAPVTLEIVNNGRDLRNGCEAFYFVMDLYGDGEDAKNADTIKETVTFPQPLAYGESYKYTFSTKVQFNKDTVYGVIAGVLPHEDEPEYAHDDNASGAILVRKSPVSTPYDFDMDQYDIEYGINDWRILYDNWDMPIMCAAYAHGHAAVTRCVSMEAGKKYRLSFDYVAGTSFLGEVFSSNIRVVFGKAGTDIKTWDTVFEDKDAFVEEFATKRILVNPTESGEYAFGFVIDTASKGGTFDFTKVAVDEVFNKDVKITDFYTTLAHITPASQINGTFKARVNLINWGSSNINNATVKLTLGENTLAEKSVNIGTTHTEKTVFIDMPISGLKLNDDITITANVVLEDDDYPDNNTLETTVKVSDSIMQHDHVSEDMYTGDFAIGSAYSDLGCGLPFAFAQKDTLTAVSVGWVDLYEDMDILIAIHKWNAEEETLGDLVYQNIYRRGTEAGQREYPLPSMLLEAGDYLISVHQTDGSFGLITTLEKGGFLYTLSDEGLFKQTDMGTPAIRAIFGHNGQPLDKELAVMQIAKPLKNIGLFSNEEPIVVKVRNNGYESLDAKLTVMVNKTTLPTQTIKVNAYGEKEFTFKGDLSAPDVDYQIVAFVELPGDKDLSNDTCIRVVRSMPPLNPYVMNFDYCDDFAVGDELVPKWKSVETSGAFYTFGLQDIDHPHDQEPVGFMAFPNGITPGGELTSHSGNLLGVVFGSCDDYGQGLETNSWLISPKVKLNAGKAKMSCYVKSSTNRYDLERYNVLVSTTNDELESFEQVGETREAPADKWTFVSVDLSQYAGKEVYVAIQCVSNNSFVFMIDDIAVGDAAGCERLSESIRATVYPNPAHDLILINAAQAIEQVSIFNLSGSLIHASGQNLNTAEYRYSVRNLIPGIYFAQVKTKQGSAVLKFVVK